MAKTEYCLLNTVNCLPTTDLVAVSGDYDGDGVEDTAFYEELTGNWYIPCQGEKSQISDVKSQIEPSGSFSYYSLTWGGPGLVPVPGDYDGDGFSDLAVYDEESGNWHVLSIRICDGVPEVSSSPVTVQWGGPGMIPESIDWDGDSVSDLCVVHKESDRRFVRTISGRILLWDGP